MTIKNSDIVAIKNKPLNHLGSVLDWDLGLVIKGPYEESTVITNSPFPVVVVEIVCDVISGDVIYKAIPINQLIRFQQKFQGGVP